MTTEEMDAEFEEFWLIGIRPYLEHLDLKTLVRIKEVARWACKFGQMSAERQNKDLGG